MVKDKDEYFFVYDDLKDEFYPVILNEDGSKEIFKSDNESIKQYLKDEAKRLKDRKKNHVIEHYNNGNIRRESFHDNDGMFHREDGPSEIEYFEDGQVSMKAYHIHGVISRKDGPAIQWWYRNGKKKSEKYFLNGKEYRTEGPTEVIWYENGNKYGEYYVSNRRYHREDGPAIIRWNEDGTLDYEQYYLNGHFQKEEPEREKCN